MFFGAFRRFSSNVRESPQVEMRQHPRKHVGNWFLPLKSSSASTRGKSPPRSRLWTNRKASRYEHHSVQNKVNMARAAQTMGPTQVGSMAHLWGYASDVAKSTVATWTSNLKNRWIPNALAGQSEPKREKRTNDPRAVPEKVKDAVLREVKKDEEQCEETTSFLSKATR